MNLFRARGVGRWVTPVDRPPLTDAERLDDIDRQIGDIAAVPPPARSEAQWRRLDRLLDMRLAVGGSRLVRRATEERAS